MLKKKWISFWDFKTTLLTQTELSDYIKMLLKHIDSDFYGRHFQNTTQTDFEAFIHTVEDNIKETKNTEAFQQRQKSLHDILPVYGALDTSGLRERDFINKIERIFRAFHLRVKGEIGIGDISLYTDANTINTPKESSSLEESIFYIPLRFDIVGKKKDVFDFLHYFEKVGAIEVSQENFSVYNDQQIRNPIVLNTLKKDGNIYEDQVAEISLFETNIYPDSSTFSNNSDTKTLLELISLNQAKERYEASVEIHFYVSGIPEYSMRKYIPSVIQKYQNLKKESHMHFQKTKKNLKKLHSGKQIQALNTLQSIEALFASIDKKFTTFQKNSRKKETTRQSFEQAKTLDKQLDLIQAKLDGALQDLK